ncbi:hypothetical protein [Rubellimicrobium roseum]|uniref:General secretion pathway protein GspK n=1 Tax=Rubellimicrobium roseum TaxID=687525 RepID=A0A5C4NDH3_9RHOB|nr:hypothetical protein [Rubellimicrobium roseum]TNC71348.1 hypothetical protein FHG71_12195 [Rubellimicrobium roseum]
MLRHPTTSRSSRKGFALIAVLAGAVLVGGLAATLRARGLAQAAVIGRIEEGHRLALGRLSVAARVGASLAGGGARPSTDGTPVRLEEDGRAWEVRLFDVEGLVDLYLAPPEVLALLGDGVAIAQQREVALSALVPGDRFDSEEQTLARLGFDAAERVRLAPFVTQRARTGAINPTLAPAELRDALGALRGDTAGGETAEIAIRPWPGAADPAEPARGPGGS